MTGVFQQFSVCDLYFFRQNAMIDGERRRKVSVGHGGHYNSSLIMLL